MALRTLTGLEVEGKRVFVRVDHNVPQDESGGVANDRRIVASLPTLRALLERGASLILASHLGRPKGQRVDRLSLAPVGERLAAHLGRPVRVLPDVVGPEVEAACRDLKPGEIVFLENVRFHPGETKNDPELAAAWASLADAYVNDAFGTAHRAHASVVGVASRLPSAAGMLLEKEVATFRRLLSDAPHPFLAVLGGAKVSDKIPVMKNLLDRVDGILVGGGMAYTFLREQGVGVGQSRVEEDMLDAARDILATADAKGVPILLPTDHVGADRFAEDARSGIVMFDFPEDWMGLDIGAETGDTFVAKIREAKAILWNGPMGVFEWKPFREGTRRVAEAIAASQGLTVVGGGDSVAAVDLLGLEDRFTHVSTGGGASLEFLGGKVLPGVAALED